MAAGDLCTLLQVQTAYPGLSAPQLADVPALIAAASLEICERYPRVAPVASHDETHDPGAAREINLRRRPVVRVARVRTDMAVVLRVAYTGAARRATVEVATSGDVGALTCTGVSLDTEAAGVVAAPTVVDFATYPTLQAVTDKINTLSGWSATLASGTGGMAAADLEPGQGPKAAGATAATLWAYTRDLADYWLADPQCGRLLLEETRGDSRRMPDRMWGADPRVCSVRVLYSAGLTTLKADVTRAAIVIVGDLLEATDKTGRVDYISSTNQAYRLAAATYRFPDVAERILSRYKRRAIV